MTDHASHSRAAATAAVIIDNLNETDCIFLLKVIESIAPNLNIRIRIRFTFDVVPTSFPEPIFRVDESARPRTVPRENHRTSSL